MVSKKRILQVIVWVIVIIALTSSGWVYNIIKDKNEVDDNKLAELQSTFIQQYGESAVMGKIVSPDRVYAAMWSDGEGVTYVSWNIGGLWVTVYSSQEQVTTP